MSCSYQPVVSNYRCSTSTSVNVQFDEKCFTQLASILTCENELIYVTATNNLRLISLDLSDLHSTVDMENNMMAVIDMVGHIMNNECSVCALSATFESNISFISNSWNRMRNTSLHEEQRKQRHICFSSILDSD